ncbi:hypothetical protein [Kitasatospora cineracea]|uniref:hypothetical protein n=1 Tax=Kitasatospora cineracea TaxID=88074 RepID=UPI00382526BD
MAAEEYLSTIDALAVRPFPEAVRADLSGDCGPEHHVCELQASRDFWDDDDGQARAGAEAGLQALLDDLAAHLTARWGEALVVDLGPYLVAGCAGEPVPEPLDHLSQQAASMQVWPLLDSGRWLALAIGQADKELPLVLFAAVGRASALGLDPGGRS